MLGLIHAPVLLTLFSEGTRAAELLSRLFFGAGIGVSLAYYGGAGFAAWTKRQWLDMVWLGCVLAVITSCGTISASFSSRYIVAGIPFLLLIAGARPNPFQGRLALALAVLGLLVGLNALRVYGFWSS